MAEQVADYISILVGKWWSLDPDYPVEEDVRLGIIYANGEREGLYDAKVGFLGVKIK